MLWELGLVMAAGFVILVYALTVTTQIVMARINANQARIARLEDNQKEHDSANWWKR